MENLNNKGINTPQTAPITTSSRIIKFIVRILKWVLILGVIGLISLYFIGSHILKTEDKIKRDLFFNGDEKSQKEFTDITSVQDVAANTGDYSGCLSLDSEHKQFCLYLANTKKPDSKICALMSKDYPADDVDSQDNCYIYAGLTTNGDKEVCNLVANKSICLNRFRIRDARFKACKPVYDSKGYLKATSEDCLNYVVSTKDKSKCDLLEESFGLSYKEQCIESILK